VRSLGPHPKDQAGVMVKKGRFGPYAQHNQTVATLPRGVLMEEITLEEAVSLLAERGKTLAPKGRKGKPARGGAKTAAAKGIKAAAAAKPPAVKKAAPKKTSVKKAGAKKKSATKTKAPAKAATGLAARKATG
jgi:DNA topoisomerase-1